VAVYFLDSSAVVKRYIRETGTAWIVSISAPTAGNELFIASVTGVEVVSAVARRRKGEGTGASTAAAALAQFRHDLAHQYQLVEITDTVVARAMALADDHALRAYDAVQLAAVLETISLRSGLPLPALAFVSADQDLNAAAQAEGVIVENPNDHS
jgi:predicted nucleic acid-binding protein